LEKEEPAGYCVERSQCDVWKAYKGEVMRRPFATTNVRPWAYPLIQRRILEFS
jgi:hypothetical protein